MPVLSFSVVVVAFGLRLWPGAVEHLAYLPSSLARGEWWRLPGCHLAHWSLDHALWDALTFLLLGAWCEAAGRGRMVAATLASAVLIPPLVLAAQPELTAYAGLSGLDVALCALLLTRVARERWREAGASLRTALMVVAAGLTAKLAYELHTGGLWFVRSHGGDFVPVPLAHLIGACIGVAVGGRNGQTGGAVRPPRQNHRERVRSGSAPAPRETTHTSRRALTSRVATGKFDPCRHQPRD